MQIVTIGESGKAHGQHTAFLVAIQIGVHHVSNELAANGRFFTERLNVVTGREPSAPQLRRIETFQCLTHVYLVKI